MAKTAPAAHVKAKFATFLNESNKGPVVITRDGKPIAVLMGVHGDVTSITYEHGTAFTITAGLMNLLLMLDAFDIAEGHKE